MNNTEPMIAARQARAAAAEQAATRSIRKFIRTGTPVTFTAVAADAGVSTGYLYRHPTLANKIRKHRPVTRPRPETTATKDSITSALRQHIRALTEEHQRERVELAAQIDQLRAELDAALGELITLRRVHHAKTANVDHTTTDKW